MKNKLYDITYFLFLFGLYIFLIAHPQEVVFEMYACSYPLFLQLIDRFSILMSTKGWRRLF